MADRISTPPETALLIQPSLAADANMVALARLPERITALDVRPVVTHDIDRVPASALIHLADQFHMRHTVAWRRARTDAERRGLIKAAVWRHRIKGTLAGFKLAARDAGAELVRAITPPAKLFSGASLTVAERNAFVARYPQLRLFRYRTLGQCRGAMPARGYAFAGACYPVVSDALLRVMPRVTLCRDGVETELTALERTGATRERTAETVTEIRAPGSAREAAFCGGSGYAAHPRFLTVSSARARMYRMRLTETYQEAENTIRRTAVTPGLDPIDVRYDQIAERGTARGLFFGQCLHGAALRSTARDRLYQRLYLFDAAIEADRRGATTFCGVGRYGMPPFHAELAVRIRGKAHPKAVWRWMVGHLLAQPQDTLFDCLEAMRDVARAADRVAIDTRTCRPAMAGERHRAGTISAGDWIDDF